MKPIPESPLNKIILLLTLSLLLAAGLWAWLTLPPAQAQGDDEDLWCTLDTPFENVGQVLEDKDGNIWVVSWTGMRGDSTESIQEGKFVLGQGLAKFEQGRWMTYTVESTDGELPGDSIHAVLFDRAGNLWLAVAANKTIGDTVRPAGVGVVRFDGQDWHTFTINNTNGGLAYDSVHDIFEDDAGHLWFATLDGLSHYDGQTWKVVADQDDLNAEGVLRVFQDSQNRLWVSLLDFENGMGVGRGVARSAPVGADGAVEGWQTFTEADGLAHDFVLTIAEDGEGNIWLGTMNGASQLDGENWETFSTGNSDLPGDIVYQVVVGYEGQMWVATHEGAAKYVGGQWLPFGDNKPTLNIFKDSESLVWFSTGSGLRYYTGYHRRTFSEESGDLGDNAVRYLFEASDGAIWVGTWGGGVSRYQDGQWQTFSVASGDLGSNDVYDLFEASDGAIWAWTGSGMSRYQDGQWQTFNRKSSDLKASDGAIWVGTWGGGVSRYQNGIWQTFSVASGDLGSNDVDDLFEASDGAIWAKTEYGGVSRYQGGQWQIFTKESGDLGSNDVDDLFEASDGAIWAKTEYGEVSRYQDGQWQIFTKESGDLGDNAVQYLFEASDGVIWARTSGGVSRYQDGQWQIFTKESGDLGDNAAQYLFEASDGAIWVGTWGGGVSRYQDGQWQTFSEESGDLGSNGVGGLIEASDGAIWAWTSGGVSRYQDGQWQTFSVASGDLGSNHVDDLFEASDGAIWAWALGGEVSRYQDGQWQIFTKESGDLGDNAAQYLFEASDGAIWAWTSGGVSRYQDGQWQTFSEESGDLGSNHVRQLFEASDGAIWAWTSGGVSRYQDGQWQTFSEESGDLGDNAVQYWFEASDGAIWARTGYSEVNRYQDGVWQTFNKESGDLGDNAVQYLFEASDGAIWAWTGSGVSHYQDGEWRTFTRKEYGTLTEESQSSRQLTDRYGFIWAATDEGLVRSLPNPRPPWVEIVTLNNIPVTVSAHTLAYDDRRRVLIGFEGEDLATRPQDLQYSYKLENSPVYADWQMADNQPILFDELDPGEYTLLVKAMDEDGNESEPAALDITVEGPSPVSMPPLEIREVVVEPRYTIPGLGMFTLPQLLGGGMGLVALLGLTGLGVTLWRRRQPPPLPKEYFNPYIVGKPVTGRNFVGRQDIFADLVTALKGDNHLIIEGERRIGKTSLLYELAEALRQDGDYCFIPAYVQLQRVTEEKLFYAIMREIARESRRRCEQLPPLRCEAPYDDYDTFDAEDDLLAIIKALEEITGLPLRIVILLDEGDRLRDFTEETHSHLRGWMGADIQKDVLVLVWCGVSFDRAWHQRTSPWYNQFRSAIELPPLSPQEARTLITHPVEGSYEYENEAIERILTLSQRKPFVIQLVCHECVRRIWQEQSGAIITLDDVDAVWPLVQRSLESDEQAEAPSEDSILPSLTYQTAAPAEQIAEETAPYNAQPEETADDP